MENNQNDDKPKLPKGSIHIGDNWVGVPASSNPRSIDIERMQAMGEILHNLKAIKGEYYVSILLVAANCFNLEMSLVSMYGYKEEILHKFAEMVQQNTCMNFGILVGAHYKDQPIEKLAAMVNDLMLDFETVMDAVLLTTKRR